MFLGRAGVLSINDPSLFLYLLKPAMTCMVAQGPPLSGRATRVAGRLQWSTTVV
jgi:hypothetical protein